jgi:carboxylesterase
MLDCCASQHKTTIIPQRAKALIIGAEVMRGILNPMETQPFPLVNPHLEGGSFIFEAGEVGVLLVHGFTATSAEVRPLAQALHAEGYTTAGPLLPGHGTTPDEINRCRWQDWYGAVEEHYQQLRQRCRKVVVGGESMGSLLTLLLAAEHPEISAVLSYAPALKFASWQAAVLPRLLSRFIAYRPKPNRGPSAADPRWQGYPVNPLRGVDQITRLQSETLRRLPRLHQPLLVVQGRKDPSLSPKAAELVYQRAGSVQKELHWFDESRHCVLIDCEMDAVNSLTVDFLRRNIPA